jgi:tetratricopeptide (TPR) repeat protein
MILLGRGAPEAALKRLDEAERLQPSIPALKSFRGVVAVANGRYAEALDLVDRYMAEVGPDPDALEVRGTALEGLDRIPEAIVSYRQALDELPDLINSIHGLCRILENDQKSEIALRVSRASDPLATYDVVYWQAHEDKDSATLDVLKAWLRKAHPNDQRTIRLELHGLIEAGNAPEAGIALRQRLASDLNDELKRTALYTYIHSMISADRHLEAYAAVPDDHAALAFRILADDIDERPIPLPLNPADGDLKLQRDLIALHHRRKPDDPWILYFEGSVLMHEWKLAEAERKFAAGQAKLPPRPKVEDPDASVDDWDANRFRGSRVFCLYQMKKGLRAYGEVGPAADTFAQLAFNYSNDKDAPGLEALIAAHRKREPKDRQLIYWSAELLYLGDKRIEASEAFLKFVTEGKDDEPNRWQAIDRCVRGYLRAKLPTKAHDAVVAIGMVPPGLRAAVHLANGRLALAEEVIAAEAKTHGGYQWLYYDEDFRRLINLPEFDSLRKKYPDTRNDPSSGTPG